LPPKQEQYRLEGIKYCEHERFTVTQKEYTYAQEVWKNTNCKTMLDYHNVYLTTDVLLLIQEFREVAYKNYGLDPMWYYSAPGLAWDALFKTTGQKLELITNLNMYQFIEKGMRGGISMVSKRYAKANNVKTEYYNKDEENTWLLYLDANNLYGWAMMQALQTGGFEWRNSNLDKLADDIRKGAIPDDSPNGYILEVSKQTSSIAY